jgi:hypothetical protein
LWTFYFVIVLATFFGFGFVDELPRLTAVTLESAFRFGGRAFKAEYGVSNERRVPSYTAVGTVRSFIVHVYCVTCVSVVRSLWTFDAGGRTRNCDIFSGIASFATSRGVRSRVPVEFTGNTHLAGGLAGVLVVATLLARLAGGRRGGGGVLSLFARLAGQRGDLVLEESRDAGRTDSVVLCGASGENASGENASVEPPPARVVRESVCVRESFVVLVAGVIGRAKGVLSRDATERRNLLGDATLEDCVVDVHCHLGHVEVDPIVG